MAQEMVHKAKDAAVSCEMGQKWSAELQVITLKQRETDKGTRCRNTELE
jgi:hypothetical protein